MSASFVGVMFRAIYSKVSPLFSEGRSVWADLAFWLLICLACAIVVRCAEPVPMIGL